MVNLSILILNYNTPKLTIECLESIIKNYSSQLANKSFEIIILDNNSKEGLETIKNFLSESKNINLPIKLVESKKNLGFAGGNNFASRQAKGEYLLFLNSDTEILDNGLLKMNDFLSQNKNVGILGGKLKNIDGSRQPSAGKFYSLFNTFLMLLGIERLGMLRSSPKSILKVDWVSGASMMIGKNNFEEIGKFDENFFMYMEDMELCFRLSKKGLSTDFFPDVDILHKNLGSSNKTYAILNIYKGLLIFYKKYKGNQLLFLKFLLKMKSLLAIFLGSITQNKTMTATYRKAFLIEI